nr:MAG TPA: hypothetical protein [Bacteriophage sp.]
MPSFLSFVHVFRVKMLRFKYMGKEMGSQWKWRVMRKFYMDYISS